MRGSPQSLNSPLCTVGSNEELTSSFEMQQQEVGSLIQKCWTRASGCLAKVSPSSQLPLVRGKSFLLDASEKMGVCGSGCYVTSQSRCSCVGSCRRQLSLALVHFQGCHTAVLAEGKSKVMVFSNLCCPSNSRTALKSREANVALLYRVRLFVGFGVWGWFFWSVWFLGYFL